jgi:membrane protease subunit (stomatin/prohibitin family)
VRDFQQAVFLQLGRPADIFKPGIYTLTQENLPLLAIRNHWKSDFQGPFRAEVFFFKTKIFIDQKWVFEKPVIQNSGIGLAWSHASGTFDVRITDAIRLIKKVNDTFTAQQVREKVNTVMASLLSDAINSEGTEETENVSSFIQQSINTELHAYGLEVSNLFIKTHELIPEISHSVT